MDLFKLELAPRMDRIVVFISGVEVMITAEDAAAGFRLLLPLPDMDGGTNLTKGAMLQCGCAADLVAGAGA